MDGMAPAPGAMPMHGAMQMDLNDIAFYAFPAKDRALSDPEVVTVDKDAPVWLRLINAASSTNFRIDLGALTGPLTAVDGMPVMPTPGRSFELTMVQRLNIEVQMPPDAGAFPILAQRDGDAVRTGILFATHRARIDRIGAMAADTSPALSFGGGAWAGGHRAPPPGPSHRLLHDQRHDGLCLGHRRAHVRGPQAARGGAGRAGRDRHDQPHHDVAPDAPARASFSGHGGSGARLRVAMRDTVLGPAMESEIIAFDADNPGDWPFHRHKLYHMASGMMTTVRDV